MGSRVTLGYWLTETLLKLSLLTTVRTDLPNTEYAETNTLFISDQTDGGGMAFSLAPRQHSYYSVEFSVSRPLFFFSLIFQVI